MVTRCAARSTTLVVTRSEHGAVACRGGEQVDVSRPSRSSGWSTRPAPATCSRPGFLAGEARGLGLEKSLKLGAIAAAEVIQHYGARPEADLKALAGDLLA